ncbi:Protein FAR1-RELATED SEQUENCE 5 [Bienertia sinuspersici]
MMIPSTSIGSLEASSSATMHQTPTMTFTPRLCLTPKGSKEWIPCCPLELKPVVGMPFDTLVDGIQFYKQYACFCGFVSRLGPEKKDDDGNVLLKYVYCNKEGYNDNGSKKSNTTNKSGSQGKCLSSFTTRKRSVNRAGCEARIAFKRIKEGQYMVNDEDYIPVEDAVLLTAQTNVLGRTIMKESVQQRSEVAMDTGDVKLLLEA